MSKVNTFQDDLVRDRAAREEWIQYRMADVPAIYVAQMPCTCDAKKLLDAESCIRAMMNDDLDRVLKERNNPWVAQTPKPKLLDFSGLDSNTNIKLGLLFSRMLGMHAAIKPGFHNHPDVLAAHANVERTAEYVAKKRREAIEPRYRQANTTYVQAVNEFGDDDDRTRKALAEVQALQVECEAAQAECDRLSKDWSAASKIVIDEDGNPIGGDDVGPHLAE
jgi:hypothetical protein